MAYHYTDPRRELDAHALPDVEVFEVGDNELPNFEGDSDEGEYMPAGWYYRFGMPGYLPDGDAVGPYDSETEAITAAREDAGVDLEEE